MAKKIVKKRKLKVVNFLLVLLILTGLFFGVYFIINIPTKNIIISGTNYLKDDYIINIADIKDYPEFLLINKNKIEKKLAKSNYIDTAKVKRRYPFVLEIKIKEAKPLFFDTNKNKFVFVSGEIGDEEISHNFNVPRLLNYVPDTKYTKFINSMGKVNDDVISKISDIEYQPNDYDKDRFLLYMDDGNMVYLTLTKFKAINHYNDVLSQIEGHKGILYLDSGNHFKIME
ncbi:MAG: FtsQ-type POTRA domain-containing protein [Bacilli bacterium]|nr:FtsQ-type POTRA domain-containing protein [Bacilli bacterium]